MKKNNILYRFIPHIIAAIFIFIITLININQFNMLVILNDEFGYWSNADLLVNRNWVDLAKETPYYSIGYSFILVPVLFFCKNYKMAYHTALVLNSVLLVVDYFCAYYIVSTKNKTSKNFTGELISVFESLAVVLLVCNIFYSNTAWCEIFLMSVVWIIAALFFSLEQKFKTYKLVILCGLVIYSYIIHQRAIGVVIAFAIVLAALLITKKKYWHLIAIVLTVGLAVFLQTQLKGLQNDLIQNMRSNQLNDYTLSTNLVSKKLKFVLQIKDFLVSFAGKIYILFVCSLGVYAVGLKVYFTKISKLVRKKQVHFFLSESFFALMIVCMVGLNTLQCIYSGERKDVIVYTRYMEFVFGPFMLVSLDYFVREIKQNLKWIVVSFLGLVPLTFVVLKLFLYANGSFNNPCSPFVASLVEFYAKDYNKVCLTIIIMLLVFLFICSVFSKKRFQKIAPMVICSSFIFINVYLSTFVNDWLAAIQTKFYDRVAPIAEIINKDYDNKPIYFITDNEKFEYSINAKYLQFVLYERPIIVVDSYGQINYEGEYFLLTNPRRYEVLESQGLEYETTTPSLNLYIVEGRARGNK